MKYILFVFLVSGSVGGYQTRVTTAEFYTQAACEQAAGVLEKKFPSGNRGVMAFCFPKGEAPRLWK